MAATDMVLGGKMQIPTKYFLMEDKRKKTSKKWHDLNVELRDLKYPPIQVK